MTNTKVINTIKKERDRYVAFAFAAADAFFEINKDGNINYVGGAAQWLVDMDPTDLIGLPFLDLVRPEDGPKLNRSFADVITRGRIGPVKLQFKHKTKNTRGVEAYIASLPNHPNSIFISLKAYQQSDITSVDFDPKLMDKETGLVNKDTFGEIAANLANSAKTMNEKLDLTFMKIEGIDTMRDEVGEESTNEFLNDIGERIKEFSVDGQAAGRLSDNHFGVIHEKGAALEPFKKGISDRAPTDISINENTLDLDSSISEEDMGKALVYAINKFTTSTGNFKMDSLDEGYKAMVAETKIKLHKFKSVVKESNFDVMLQPIVNLKDLSVHHYEALVRFHHQSSGESPYELITFAEDVGIIHDFDMAMVRKVIEKIERGKKAGAELVLAVNLSGASLQHEPFVAELLKIVKKGSDIRNNLMFEVTESSKISNLEAVNNVLKVIRKAGHHICLDDFGAGAAGFQYLKVLEIDTVKIDGIYIREALQDPHTKSLLESMAKLCKEINVDTVGEWVETKEQWNFLKSIGVDYGQGYLFGKPAMGTVGKTVRLQAQS